MEYFEHLDLRTCENCKKPLNSPENYLKIICLNYHVICNECLDNNNQTTTDQLNRCLISCPYCQVKFDDRYLVGDLLEMLKFAAQESKLKSAKITGLLGLVASFKQQINILLDKILQIRKNGEVDCGRSSSLEKEKNKMLQQVRTNLAQAIYTIDKMSCKKQQRPPLLFSSKNVLDYNNELIIKNNIINRYLIEAQLNERGKKRREQQLYDLQNNIILKKHSYNLQEELSRQKKQRCKKNQDREVFTPKFYQNQNQNGQNNLQSSDDDNDFLQKPSEKKQSQKPKDQGEGKKDNKSRMQHLIKELLNATQGYFSQIKQRIHFIPRPQKEIMTKDQPIIEQEK